MTKLKPLGLERNCKNCYFWHTDFVSGHEWRTWAGKNQCRKHAPVAVESVYRGRAETAWPQTEGKDFCGDFVMLLIEVKPSGDDGVG